MATEINFEELPEGWETTTLGKCCVINPSKKELKDVDPTKDISFVPMDAVSEKTKRIETRKIRKIKDVIKGYTYFRENDVIFAKITPCMENGKVAIATGLQNNIGFGSTEFHVLRASERVIPKYIFYYISSGDFREEARRNMTGTAGQLRVPVSFMENTVIQIPPLQTQQKIVAKLDTFFEHYNELKKQHELEKSRAGKIMQAAISKLIPSPEEDLPENFVIDKINDLTTLVSSGITPLGGAKHYSSSGEVAFIRSQNVLMNKLDLSNVAYIEKKLHEEMKRTHLKKGDVLLNITGASIGRVAAFQENLIANVNQHVCILRPINEKIRTKYLEYYLSSAFVQNKINTSEQGVTRQALNFEQIRNFDVPHPRDTVIQDKTVSKILVVQNNIESVKVELNRKQRMLELLPNAVLQKAFRGELVS